MKKKVLIGIASVIVIVLMAVVGMKVLKKTDSVTESVIAEKVQIKNDIGDSITSKIFTNYEDFSKVIQSSNITESDFKLKNYVLLSISYDSCSEENIKPINYKVENDTLMVTLEYTAKCGLCAIEQIYYVLEVEKNIEASEITYTYKSRNDSNCPSDVAYKPMIYLYPTEPIEIEVKLGNSHYLTTTYPKYENGWQVIAYPGGTLKNPETNKEYYGLYWEGNNHKALQTEEGFVIKGEDTISFLEDKLKILGLNDREANEFIIYWLPKLEKNKYNYIRFETIEEINNYMPLSLSKEADTIIRILMDYKPLNNKIKVKEQQLTTPKRQGFTVVEWGGSIIK